MSNEAVVFVIFIFVVLVLLELEQIRKDAALIRALMEMDGSTWRTACKDIGSIRRMLETQIMDSRDRRVRDAARD